MLCAHDRRRAESVEELAATVAAKAKAPRVYGDTKREVIPAHRAGLDDNAPMSTIIAAARANGMAPAGQLWARLNELDAKTGLKSSPDETVASLMGQDLAQIRGTTFAEVVAGERLK